MKKDVYKRQRQSRGASEKLHGAVIDHYGGDDTRVFREVTKVGETLAQMQELSGAICRDVYKRQMLSEPHFPISSRQEQIWTANSRLHRKP